MQRGCGHAVHLVPPNEACAASASQVGSGSKAEILVVSTSSPLFLQQRTLSDALGTSASCQLRTHAAQQDVAHCRRGPSARRIGFVNSRTCSIKRWTAVLKVRSFRVTIEMLAVRSGKSTGNTLTG